MNQLHAWITSNHIEATSSCSGMNLTGRALCLSPCEENATRTVTPPYPVYEVDRDDPRTETERAGIRAAAVQTS